MRFYIKYILEEVFFSTKIQRKQNTSTRFRDTNAEVAINFRGASASKLYKFQKHKKDSVLKFQYKCICKQLRNVQIVCNLCKVKKCVSIL
jgi:hypothetical protein